ncbi:hypothetical protein [Nocardiopsis sp. JB363]|uniref:hypothetical protein n=1 Tax=Nocardiopsis sp. JB363 TaxID=1434837 RepID=UPI00097A1C83|nr:hypothetical protein [Nocardiopsis sp. JB363]SIO89391.1 hypothetical protein BQ8420_21355 [Nocardiopsis sp. JB363]
MSEWTWEFHPPELSDGLPIGAIAEIERIATELVFLGRDAEGVGKPTHRVGGLRQLPLGSGSGFIVFMVVDHLEEILILQVNLL